MSMMRAVLLGVMLMLGAGEARAENWLDWATVSMTDPNTAKLTDRYICYTDGANIACNSPSLYLSTGGLVGINTNNPNAQLDVHGTVSATNFVGDGSGLTGVVAASGDRIVSGSTDMRAIGATGYISLTQDAGGGAANTGWFSPYTGLVTLGVSATGPISGTEGYFAGRVGIGTTGLSKRLTVLPEAIDGGIAVREADNGSNAAALYANNSRGALALYNGGVETLMLNGNSGSSSYMMSSLGVGTASPQATLQVSGSFVVSMSSAPTSPSLFVGLNGNVGIGRQSIGGAKLIVGGDILVTDGAAGNFIEVRNGYNWTGRVAAASVNEFALQYYNGGGWANGISVRGITGRVGVSNSNPLASLDVAGTISASDAIQVSGTSLSCGPGIPGAIQYSGGALKYCNGSVWTTLAASGASDAVSPTGAIQFSADGAGAFGGDASNLFWNNSLKWLGIGTNAPLANLSLVGANDPAVEVRVTTGAMSQSATLRLVGSNSISTSSQEVKLVAYQPSGGGSIDTALDLRVRKPGDVFGSPTTVMTLLGSGNVGIGTASPDVRLAVTGSISASGDVKSTVNNRTKGVNLTAVGAVEIWRDDDVPFIDFKTTEGEDFDTRIQQTNDGLQFWTGGTGSTTKKMTLTSGGNLGLGTTTPSQEGSVSSSTVLHIESPVSNGTAVLKLGDDSAGRGNGLIEVGAAGYLSGDHWAWKPTFGVNLAVQSPNGTSTVFYTPWGITGRGYGGLSYDYWGTVHFYGYTGDTYRGGVVTPLERMVIKGDTGNVGISVTNPNAKLEVAGTISATNLVVNGVSVTGGGGGSAVSGTGAIQFSADGAGAFGADDKYLHWDNANKRLGIGTASPPVSFYVSATGGGAQFQFRDDQSPAMLMSDGSGNYSVWAVASVAGHWSDMSAIGDSILRADKGNLILSARNTSGSIVFGSGAADSEKVRITSAGNVGIGTTAAGLPLAVSGSMNLGDQGSLTNSTWAATPEQYGLTFTGGAIQMGPDSVSATNRLQLHAPTSIDLFIDANNSQTNDSFTIGHNASAVNAGNYAELFRVNENGNVGIGTATPSHNLTVADSDSEAIRIESTGSFAGVRLGADVGSNKDLLMHYGGNSSPLNQLRFGRYGDNNGAWEASPVVFDMDAPDGTLFLNGAGNVGIGTASPNAKLDVYGTISATNLVVNGVSITGGGGAAVSNTGAVQFSANGAGAFGGDTSNLFWDNANKRLGIGTATPTGSLEVSSSSGVNIGGTGASILELGQNSYGNQLSYIDLTGDDTYTDYGLRIIRFNSGPNADSIVYHRGTGKLGLATQEAAPIAFLTSGTERVRITSLGNVGIGTVAPTQKLDVAGSMLATGMVQSGASSGGVALTVNDGYGNANVTFNHAFGTPEQNGNAGRIVVNTDATSAASMEFSLKDNVSASSAVGLSTILHLQSDVRVGIGTSSPAATLDVSGSLKALDAVTIARGSGAPGLTFTNSAFSGGNGSIGYWNTGVMVFVTSATEAMRILPNGNVGIGTTNPQYALDVSGTIRHNGFMLDLSDRRLKQDIALLPAGLENVLKLEPVSFRMKSNPGQTELGFIAQDVRKVFPELVSAANDASKTLSLNYVGLIAPMVKGMQELKAANDNLVSKTEYLERQLKAANDNGAELTRKVDQLLDTLEELKQANKK